MKIDRIRILGLTVTTMVALILLFLIARTPFIHIGTPHELIKTEMELINWRIDLLVWSRLLDVAAMVLTIFAAVACAISLLRPEEGE